MNKSGLIFFLAMISFLIGTDEYIIVGILDKIAATSSISVSSVGQLITVFSISFGILTPIVIVFTRRMDRKKLLIIALLIFAVSNAAVALFSSFYAMFVARVGSGISAGLIEVTLLTIATSIADPHKKGSAIATVITGFSAALIVGVPLGRYFTSILDWRFLFIGLAVLGLLFMVIVHRLIPNLQGGKEVSLREELKGIQNKKIVYILGITFLWMFSYSVLFSYITPYLLQVIKITGNMVSISLLIYGVSGLVGSKLGGYSTDKLGSTKTLYFGMIINMIGISMFSFIGTASMLFFIPLIIWGLAAWSSGSAIQSKLISLAPAAASIILSLYTSISQLGMAFGSGIGGVIVKISSLEMLIWAGAASLVLVVLLLVHIQPANQAEAVVLNK